MQKSYVLFLIIFSLKAVFIQDFVVIWLIYLDTIDLLPQFVMMIK